VKFYCEQFAFNTFEVKLLLNTFYIIWSVRKKHHQRIKDL